MKETVCSIFLSLICLISMGQGFPVQPGSAGFPVRITNYGESVIGDIYNKSGWNDLSEFIVPTGFSIVDNNINVAASQSGQLIHNYVTALNTFKLSFTYFANNSLTNAVGLKIGFKSLNNTAPNSCDFYFNESTRKIAYFKTATGTTDESSQTLPAYTAGDTLRLTVNSTTGNFTVTLENLTKKTSISRTDNVYPPSKNTSNFVISSPNTTVAYTITAMQFSSDHKRGGTLVVGNSIDVGSAATTNEQKYAILVGAQVAAGSGDKTREVVMRLPEIVKLAPTQVLLKIGTNDTDLPTFKSNYTKIVNTLTDAGIKIVHVTVPPNSNRDMTAYVDWVKSSYPTSTIDIFTPMKAVSGTGMNPSYDSGDGVHPNNSGHAVMASTILASPKFSAKAYSQEMAGVYAARIPAIGITPGTYGPGLYNINAEGRITSATEMFTYDKTLNRLNLGTQLISNQTIEAQSFRGPSTLVVTSQGFNSVSISTQSQAKVIARFHNSGGVSIGEINDPGTNVLRVKGLVNADSISTTGKIIGGVYTATGVTSTGTIQAPTFRGSSLFIASSQGTNDLVFQSQSSSVSHFRIYGGSGGMYFGSSGMNDPGAGTARFGLNVVAPQFRLSALNTAPISSSATGTTGEIRITATHIYVCTATNTWVRAALTTF